MRKYFQYHNLGILILKNYGDSKERQQEAFEYLITAANKGVSDAHAFLKEIDIDGKAMHK